MDVEIFNNSRNLDIIFCFEFRFYRRLDNISAIVTLEAATLR